MSPIIPVAPATGEESEMVSSIDDTNAQVILTGMAAGQASASESLRRRFDQLSADASAMWSVAMTTPTVFAGMGFRVAQQSGGWPAASGTGTGA